MCLANDGVYEKRREVEAELYVCVCVCLCGGGGLLASPRAALPECYSHCQLSANEYFEQDRFAAPPLPPRG